MALVLSLIGLIVEMSAKSYQTQPERSIVSESGEVDEVSTANYRDILKKSNFRTSVEDLDQLARF